MMKSGSQIIIVGGGITGISAAYELSRARASVTVVEQGSLAHMGSGRTLAGVRQSARHPSEMPLAMAAVNRWQQLHEELSADLEYRQNGNLRLAEDHQDVSQIQLLVDRQVQLGLDIEFLHDSKAVRSLAPAISERVLAASYCPSDGHANPVATVHAFAEAARRHDACILENTRVTEVEVEGDRVTGVRTDSGTFSCDSVVVAAGIDTPRILGPLGLKLPISLALVPVVQTVAVEPLLEQVLGTAKAHFAARQEVSGQIRFSSGGHPVNFGIDQVTPARMQPGALRTVETVSRGISILPALADIPVRQIWGGLVDLTPDGVPVIDTVDEVQGLFVAAGFSGHGFCLGPVSGQIIREQVLGEQSSFNLEPFRWGRFENLRRHASPELLG